MGFNVHGIKEKTGIDRIFNASFNDIAGALKICGGGSPIDTSKIWGTNSNTLQLVGPDKTLRVINTDTAYQYITFGDATITTPTISTGAALAPGQEYFFSTGDVTHFITSSNKVQVIALME